MSRAYYRRRSVPLLAIIGTTLLGLLLTPWILWMRQPARLAHILILDKTVAEQNYREHRGLIWMLRHLKIIRPADRRHYEMSRDYFGFVPGDDYHFDIRPMPEDLSSYDLLYIADTYGVYQDDFYGSELVRAKGTRSRLIYGGLEDGEMSRIEKAVAEGKPMIAEFNTFESPTNDAVRSRMLALLGLRWSGWIARYFPDLKAGVEVPEWALVNYQSQYGRPWDFRGPGFLFVNKDDRILVLREGEESGKGQVRIDFPDEEQSRYGVDNFQKYLYWFDIVEALPGTDIVAQYRLDILPRGHEKLREAGIPLVFPAITRKSDGPAPVHYFAGDFVDMKFSSFFWRVKGLEHVMRYFSKVPGREDEAFFWSVYYPIVQTILNQWIGKP